jgi:uncharacterized protein (TIGR02186 family)
VKRLFAVLCLVLLGAGRDPILVPEVSQHEVKVWQGFTGTELLLYGAILDPAGARAARDYDIVVVLKGPSRAITVREKQKHAGIWFNAASTQFRSAPAFYAVASTRPLEQIVDPRTAAIYELGLPFIQLSPIGSIEPVSQVRFAAGLAGQMASEQLYQQNPRGVTISEQVLYQARIELPSNVPTGNYTAETFAISKGRVVASAVARVNVEKSGFEKAVADFARHRAFFYGLLAVGVSVGMGWLAGRLFALV